MVRTDDDIENMPAHVRIKHLKELRAQKQQELESLMKQKEEDLKVADRELQRSEEDLLEQEELQHEQEMDEHSEQEKLEERLEQVPEQVPDNVTYESPLERIPGAIYEFTDYNIYNELRDINQSMINNGYISGEQQRRINQIRQQSDALRDSYTPQQLQSADSSRGNYLTRVVDMLNNLDKEKHDVGTKY